VGEKYHDKACNSANDENNICWGRECMACQPVIEEYCKSDCYDSCEGYCDEYIQEWWRDVKCYTCKAGDTCDDMTHYCRCEKFELESEVDKDEAYPMAD